MNAQLANMKYSGAGNGPSLPHQLTEESNVEPTPNVPQITIWHCFMDMLRRQKADYIPNYPLPPNISYHDCGRMISFRSVL